MHYTPDLDYIAPLVAQAAEVAGSRNKLASLIGVSRRRLGYLESGFRTLPDGRVTETRPTFAEQVILEVVAWQAKL